MWLLSSEPHGTQEEARKSSSERGGGGGGEASLAAVIKQCASPLSRIAPLSPDGFRRELALRSFAREEADEPLVASLYAAQFRRVLGGTTLLDFSALGWADAEAERLADALASGELEHLEWLLLNANQIGTRGATAVVRALEHCAAIRFVRLDDNAIHDTDKVANLVLRSAHLGRLGLRLELGDNLPCLPFPWEKNATPVTVRLDAEGEEGDA
mmetsp:Transcript_36885/g.97555  ORF Transcript_36885/g.97555 Transcript_36885/m.97555 type:complete len:213 (+) Transcript_36885:94-732(+)